MAHVPAPARFLHRLVPELLEVLREGEARITFFVLGSLYETCPELIHRIRDAGHEIGYHSHTHPRLATREGLEGELARSARFLDAFRPRGFRAPFLHLPETLVPVLAEHGFTYDSSTFGPPGAAYERAGLEVFPVTSLPWAGADPGEARYPAPRSLHLLSRELPVGSGITVSYLRHAYDPLLRHLARRGRSCVFYLHPWQLGGDPRVEGWSWRSGLRYVHTFPLMRRLERWVRGHRFRRLDARQSGEPEPGSHYLTIDFE